MMTNDVVPAMQSKFPTSEQTRCIATCIQQDGAPSHIPTENEDDMWFEEMETLGLSDGVQLCDSASEFTGCQCQRSRFLQRFVGSCCPMNSLELIEMETMCYNEHPANKINRIWLTYQSCLNKIIKCNGHNTCKIPHMNKEKLEHTNRPPLTLDVCEEGVALLQGQTD